MRLPTLPARDPHEPHRTSSAIELLFDLVTVVAIAAVTAGLHHAIVEGHGLAMLPRFIFVFFGIWWAWMNFTWFSSAFENDGPYYRLLVMVVMTGEIIFAGGAAYIEQTLDMKWGILGWSIMRIGMALLWLRASSNVRYRKTALSYMWGILFAQLCWILLYFIVAPSSNSFLLWAVVIYLIELSVPVVSERHGLTPFHRHHLVERYGGLTIISLGEILVSVAAGFGLAYSMAGTIAPGISAFAAIVLIFAIFSLYFTSDESAPPDGMAGSILWGYGHLLIFGGIAIIGGAIGATLDVRAGHGEATIAQVSPWIGVPFAVVMMMIWVVRDRRLPIGDRKIVLPIMSAVSLLASAIGLPLWCFSVIGVVAVMWRLPTLNPFGTKGQGVY